MRNVRGSIAKFAPRTRALLVLAATIACLTSCSDGAGSVEIELRLAGRESHGDRLTRCLPRDPVRATRPTPSSRAFDLWASREADLRVRVPARATIEAQRIPALDVGVAGFAAPEVWLAAWVEPELTREVRNQLVALDWCDVIVDVAGKPRGEAELRAEAARLPAGTFSSLEEVVEAFPQAKIVIVETGDEAAKELVRFWAERQEDVWRAVACDPELRARLEAEEPAGFASALAEVELRGPVDCGDEERASANRVR